jgi:hypothetical protein
MSCDDLWRQYRPRELAIVEKCSQNNTRPLLQVLRNFLGGMK